MNAIQEKATESGAGFMGVREASAFTGYSPRYLYKLTSEKRIPFYKPLGGRIVFKRADLEAFMLRGRVKADYELAAEADALLAGGRR